MMSGQPMYANILLDTCSLLWLAHGDDKLSTHIKMIIAQADNVYISAITGFEISIKYAKNKLIAFITTFMV